MKTKQFKIHQKVIKEAIIDLVKDNEKVNKTTITNNITKAISRIIENGFTDYTLYYNWNEYEDVNKEEWEKINKYFEKYKDI